MDQVICPHCGKQVELTAALRHEIEAEVSQKLKLAQEKDLEKIRQEALQSATKKLQEEADFKFKNFQNENEELKTRNRQLQEQLLEMNKLLRQLKEQNEKNTLENERRLTEQLEKLRSEIQNQAEEKYKLQIAEREKQLEDTKKALDEAQKKTAQGSQQLQGEVLELDLEEKLRVNFPYDEIQPVPKGATGGDIWQKVRNSRSQVAGSILWETKRTKAWSNSWLPKFREDMRSVGASSGILISEAIPEKLEHFGLVDGVWVCSYKYALALATVLRSGLMQIAAAKSAAANKDEKLEELYLYLTSEGFRHRFEAQVESAVELQNDLEAEKRSALRGWKRRELQIKRLIGNTSTMYGELQGIVGAALPAIKSLDTPEVHDEEELKLLD